MTSIASKSSQASQLLREIYRILVLIPWLIIKIIRKPQYIGLFFWAYQQLSRVDGKLKEMALEALKTPSEKSFPLSSELAKEIRQRAVAIAGTAKFHHCRPMCLHRSLVLYQWLKEQGITPQLEVGWGSDNIGHAWVSYNGKVLNDRADIANLTPRLMKS
jgi:uncharacterized membrane protein